MSTGDKVECIVGCDMWGLVEGEIYTITNVMGMFVSLQGRGNCGYRIERFMTCASMDIETLLTELNTYQ